MIRQRRAWIGFLLMAILALLVSPAAAQTPAVTPVSALLPLADPGPYTVGWRVVTLTDASRDGRSLIVFIWYPAIAPEHPTDQQTKTQKLGYGWRDAALDPQAAPYPLILFSPPSGGGNHRELEVPLASQGFVVAGIERLPNDDQASTVLDRPLDMLFVLDQLTISNQRDFDGMIDTNHIGVMGMSFGGYTTLALAGARIDPTAASALTKAPLDGSNPNDPRNSFADWNWDALQAARAKLAPPLTGDGLWPTVSDPRIQAALAFSPCLVSVFGDAGLAAATVPTLIVGATTDDVCPYQAQDVYAYDHLGSPEHSLLSIIGGPHMAGVGDSYQPAINQLAAAFFGNYLQGKAQDMQYLSAAYVDSITSQFDHKLVWGSYQAG